MSKGEEMKFSKLSTANQVAGKIMEIRKGADRIVRELFALYFERPQEMSHGWAEGLADAPMADKARAVADFLAGMTDNFAISEHRRLFDDTPDMG